MAWITVNWYSLGFNIIDKQFYLYYSLEGDGSVYQLFITAPEMSALADMFRNEGPVKYNSDGHYFVTNQDELVVHGVTTVRLSGRSRSGSR